jgi:transglutaminase-like putative cysteine protease
MSRVRISHTTTYRYAEPVAFGIHRLVIRRDMATLLLEVARSLRLASRFASGYLDGAASDAIRPSAREPQKNTSSAVSAHTLEE